MNEEIDVEEQKYPKIPLWLVWTVNPLTSEHMLRSVCTDEKLADWHRRALEYHIKDAKEGGHGGGEIGNRLVVVERSDANHLYGERTMTTIRGAIEMDSARSI